MKFSPIAKAGAAFAVAGGIALAGTGAANADDAPPPVEAGHVDIVEVECVDGVYEVVSHVVNAHVEPEDIGDYQFILDESASNGYITWTGIFGVGLYKASTGNDATMPDLGFAYEAEGEGCAATIGVDMYGISGGQVLFNAQVNGVPGYEITGTAGNARLALTNTGTTHHIHGDWFYGPVAHNTQNFSIGFNVYNAASGGSLIGSTVAPVNITVQP